jgi:hypothetical protein
MDPIGLALENFDAIGRWRDLDGESRDRRLGRAVRRHEGERRGGPAAGAAAAPEVLVGTMAEKLMTYALGRVARAARHAGRCAPSSATLGEDGYRFSALVKGRDQHAVPDAAQGVVMFVPQACTCRGGPCCKGWARRCRCRSSTRWCRRSPRRRGRRRAAQQAAGVRLRPARRHPRPVDA